MGLHGDSSDILLFISFLTPQLHHEFIQQDWRSWGSWTLSWLQPNLLTSDFSKELLTRDPLGAANASLHS